MSGKTDLVNPKLSWPLVVLVLGLAAMLLGTVTFLSIKQQDVVSILASVGSLVVLIAGLFGYNNLTHKVEQVHDISNGRLTQLMEENKNLQTKLQAMALAMPPTTPIDAPVSPPAVTPAP